jgi:hypothetical protein
MRAATLLLILLSASALADPNYQPAYSQADAQQAQMAFQASNAAGFSMCMTCSASLQVWKAATLVQYLAQCQKDYASNQAKAQKCMQFWQTFLQ